MSLALWLSSHSAGLGLDLLESAAPPALASGGRGASSWVSSLVAGATASVGAGSSLNELAVVIEVAQICLVEDHVQGLLPIIMSHISPGARGGARGGALAVMAAIFGRWDELSMNTRSMISSAIPKMLPFVCTEARSGPDAEGNPSQPRGPGLLRFLKHFHPNALCRPQLPSRFLPLRWCCVAAQPCAAGCGQSRLLPLRPWTGKCT